MSSERQSNLRLRSLLQQAAAAEVSKSDPWEKYHIERVPAERIIRHTYNPVSRTWQTDETIVKMEPEPFAHGAMRYCYRMKKRSPPPQSASNSRFHKFGWSHASKYVAKAYHKDGQIDASDDAKEAVRNDIMLQYEANHWAAEFNKLNPPCQIIFIRAYAIEFPNRPGRPWLAVERFITGRDSYGAGFTKHNTNSGFVDTSLRRKTPQIFSAFSFYASKGNRLVADIQGVGDLYTDPQVLSSDYRFGEGDLGPRGMALFFKGFRHHHVSDALGVPIFALSKNELRVQEKYDDDDEATVSTHDTESYCSTDDMDQVHAAVHAFETLDDDGDQLPTIRPSRATPKNRFEKLDLNRLRRSTLLKSPRDILRGHNDESDANTEKRANLSRAAVSKSLRTSLRLTSPAKKHTLHRSRSDVDEVAQCVERAKTNYVFTHRDFHRKQSGQIIERSKKTDACNPRSSTIVRKICSPMVPDAETLLNLGNVHYQLAVLHGMDRFPDVVPARDGDDAMDRPSHDVFSVLFHLSYAAGFENAPACLAMGRVQSGLTSSVSNLLTGFLPTDFDAAKQMLRRAMSSPHALSRPKAAAGCLLYQILSDEKDIVDDTEESHSKHVLIQVLEETLLLLKATKCEADAAEKHQVKLDRGCNMLMAGDRVTADYCLEGTYYAATVISVSEDGAMITVQYDDDGSEESLPHDHVRPIIPPTATQTTLGGPLSDYEAFGDEDGDDGFLMDIYELQAELADLKEQNGDLQEARELLLEAADGAMSAGKMKSATEWSLKAAEL